MAGKRARVDTLAIATTVPATKRTRVALRHCGTASQPVPVDTQPSSLSPPPSPPPPPPPQSPRQALVASSQAPNFEATIQASRAEATILPPNKGSEQATIATSAAGGEAIDTGFVWVEDNYKGFDWSCYPNHCKPPTTLSSQASWVYNYGYRIALHSNLSKILWICHYCYRHKYTILGRGVLDVSSLLSSPARHL
ncbi:hypothetical protein EJ02DRAFT_459812 [Clathrospora elynae]|uniref:Uncharacterized protein n=1 Tax=Clathrospora elynae TaxID=706981 RepID=A0A6A5SCD6_9PLEO|nr:hypothetical protein EJ02DRAFT_459812 [Clathrospora elynae]